MNNKAIVIKNQSLDVMTLGEILAGSGFFLDSRQAAQAVVKVLAGQEIGIGAIASMTGIHIIKGKPTYSANVMAAVIKNHPTYNYRVRILNNEKCSIEFYDGKTVEGISDFSVDDAKQAGLTTGNNGHSWKKYPRNMLFARCISNGAKWYCPDAFSGVSPYTPDELDIVIDGETGEPVRNDFSSNLEIGNLIEELPETNKQLETVQARVKELKDKPLPMIVNQIKDEIESGSLEYDSEITMGQVAKWTNGE